MNKETRDNSEDRPDDSRPKKSLGQNFLTSVGALEKMIEAGEVKKGDTVLEIGPGKGALTKKLLERGAHVVAIEKDSSLVALLRETFDDAIASDQLDLREEDALEFDPDIVFGGDQYKIVANIPYYITNAIIRKYLSAHRQPSRMTILVQKEVAERIMAADGKESILSLSVKAYGTPLYGGKVKAGSFFPQPSVDSAILSITGISKGFFKDFSEELFFSLVKAGFSQKRKRLARNLEQAATGMKIAQSFSTCSIDLNARAEDLALETWSCIAAACAQ